MSLALKPRSKEHIKEYIYQDYIFRNGRVEKNYFSHSDLSQYMDIEDASLEIDLTFSNRVANIRLSAIVPVEYSTYIKELYKQLEKYAVQWLHGYREKVCRELSPNKVISLTKDILTKLFRGDKIYYSLYHSIDEDGISIHLIIDPYNQLETVRDYLF